MSKKNEMEELYLQCVEEVKRDIIRRRGITMSRQGGKLDPESLKVKT